MKAEDRKTTRTKSEGIRRREKGKKTRYGGVNEEEGVGGRKVRRRKNRRRWKRKE